MKFLHTADWQIGRTYSFEGGGDGHDPSAAMSLARFDAITAIAELATKERADAILVAGDVFDRQGVSDTTLRRLFNALDGFKGAWILLPGNHDAALGESVWTRAHRLKLIGSNVTLALEPKVYEFPDSGIAIMAAPLTQRQTHTDLTSPFDNLASTPGLLRIGLAHGCVEGILPDAADSPNPIAADRAARAHLDYLALGDWHGTKQVDARTWYSGTPEQDRFKDNDCGNVLIVEIDSPGSVPRVTPIRIGRFRWHHLVVEINGVADTDALAERLTAFGGETVLRLNVTGVADLAATGLLRSALEAARARLHVLEDDLIALRLEPTDADLAAMHVDGVLAEVVSDLRHLAGPPAHDTIANEALRNLFILLANETAASP